MGNNRGGGERKRKAPQSGVGGNDKWAWIAEGVLCEVEWDGEYWQAKILRVKSKTQNTGGGSMLPSHAPPISLAQPYALLTHMSPLHAPLACPEYVLLP